MNIFEQMQNCTTPFGLLFLDKQRLLEQYHSFGAVEFFNRSGTWEVMNPHMDFEEHLTYRINPVFSKPSKDQILMNAIFKFLENSSWLRYGDGIMAIEMKVRNLSGPVQCGVKPFQQLEDALRSVE
jgi:hypothetical protein